MSYYPYPEGPSGFTLADIYVLILVLSPTVIILFSILFGGDC